MHICYVDESGNDQLLDCRDASPVLAIVGVVVSQVQARNLMWEFLEIKKKFNPQAIGKSGHLTDLIRYEIKGGDLRADIRSESRRRQRRAFGVIGATMDALERCNATVDGEVWIKRDGAGVPQAFYPTAISGIAKNFNSQLAAADSMGVMILDARTKVKNVPSVHGITTRRFRSGGDSLPNLLESPVFGHSDAHVMLQVADIVASALVFPLACAAYCADLEGNVHPHENYVALREHYGLRLRDLEHRYLDNDGLRKGGIAVRDKRGQGEALDLYRAPAAHRERPTRPPRTRVRSRSGVPLDG